MRERIIIVFIAIVIGLLITTLLFFLYQQTKITPAKAPATTETGSPTLSPKKPSDLIIDSPQDESLSDRRTIEVKGKTSAQSTVTVSTNQEDVVAQPASDGSFSVTISIAAGANKIVTRAIKPNGEESSDTRVVTYSTESF